MQNTRFSSPTINTKSAESNLSEVFEASHAEVKDWLAMVPWGASSECCSTLPFFLFIVPHHLMMLPAPPPKKNVGRQSAKADAARSKPTPPRAQRGFKPTTSTPSAPATMFFGDASYCDVNISGADTVVENLTDFDFANTVVEIAAYNRVNITGGHVLLRCPSVDLYSSKA
jgi:hypothetical protein